MSAIRSEKTANALGPFPQGDRVAASQHGPLSELQEIVRELEDVPRPPPPTRTPNEEWGIIIWVALALLVLFAGFGWLMLSPPLR